VLKAFLLSMGTMTRGLLLPDASDTSEHACIFSAWALTADRRWNMYDAPFAILQQYWIWARVLKTGGEMRVVGVLDQEFVVWDTRQAWDISRTINSPPAISSLY
jgi:hypothetical protein